MLNSPIDEIKNRLDVADVVREYVKLEKAGINYRALCPFHSEKTPSFFVNPSRQRWHCFGSCSEGGDIFKFIMKIEGVEFADALRILAAKAGVELKRQDPKIRTERQKTYEICEWAARFFEKQTEGRTGKSALEYLSKRGIGDVEVKEWRIGYAPDSWDDLISFLSDKGYSGEDVASAGLAGKKEGSSKYYNRFRGRIMFPIFDINYQPVGFGGRIFDTGGEERKEAKYLNTPNTVLYDKSRALYGLNRAKMEIRKKDSCVLMEGYTDVIMSHKTGINNAVSASGTALTRDQLSIIKRYTENLVTAFDMDDAGGSATQKGIDLALSMGFNVRVVLMPSNLDPADMILKDPKSWEKVVKEAVSVMDFFFQRAFSGKDPSIPENKKKIAANLLPEIARISNDIERHSWIQKLARDLRVSEDAVITEMKKIKRFSPEKAAMERKIVRKSRKEMLEERFLMLVAGKPSLLKNVSEEEEKSFSEENRKIISFLKSGDKEVPAEIKEKIECLAMKMEIEEEGIKVDEESLQCLCELRSLDLKAKLKEISDKIREAEAKKDFKVTEELTKEFNSISRSLCSIKEKS